MLPEVLETMLPYFRDTYGNPQSLHDWGDEAREANEEARGKVATLIGAQPEEIIFTGSGTERPITSLLKVWLRPSSPRESILSSRPSSTSRCSIR